MRIRMGRDKNFFWWGKQDFTIAFHLFPSLTFEIASCSFVDTRFKTIYIEFRWLLFTFWVIFRWGLREESE